MTSKSSTMSGIAAGMVAGMMLGTVVGVSVKNMMTPKSPMKKKVSSALNTMSDMFGSLAKFTN